MISNKTRKLLQTSFAYAALALGVTVGGVVVGATVIAPVVSKAAPYVERSSPAATDAPTAFAETPASEVAPVALAQTIPAAAATTRTPASIWARASKQAGVLRRDIKSWPLFRHMPEVVWLYIGVGAAMAVAAMIGWRLRVRTLTEAATEVETAVRATAAIPSKLTLGRGSRTPRAVLALAEAGNAPADIARRTGLSLDAVAMCLSLSSFAARQLRPPTA